MTPFYRRTILALISIFVDDSCGVERPASLATAGQKQTDGADRGNGRAGRGQGGELIKKLNLNADQKKQFRQIRQESMQQAKAIRADNSLSQPDKKQKLRELHKQTMDKVMTMLNPEQKEQLKKTMEERRNNRKNGKDTEKEGSTN